MSTRISKRHTGRYLLLAVWQSIFFTHLTSAAQSIPGLAGSRQTVPADTVFVTSEMTTYLIFPGKIEVLDIGSKQYAGKVESGNMLFLKPLRTAAAPSSLLVRTAGEQIYLRYLAYREHPPKTFYDYRAGPPPDAAQGSTGASAAPADKEVAPPQFAAGMAALEAQPAKRWRTASAYRIRLTLSHLAVDSSAVYLLFALGNKSTIPYQIDYVSFAYKERATGKPRRKPTPEPPAVVPLFTAGPATVAPRQQACLAYALPLHGSTRRGYLEIVFRESQGNRVVRVRIPARTLSSAPFLLTQTAYHVR
jgi:hypothetical protein